MKADKLLLGVTLAFVIGHIGGNGLAAQSSWKEAIVVSSELRQSLGGKEISLTRPVWSGNALLAIVANAGFLQTRDFATWKLIPIPMGYNTFDSVYASGPRKVWAASSNNSDRPQAVILGSEDGAETWQFRSSLASMDVRAILDMHLSESGVGWAVGLIMPGQRGVILRTSDGGRSWAIEYVSEHELYRIVRVGENTYVSGVGAILRSGESGGWTVGYRGEGKDYAVIRDLAAPDLRSVIAMPDRAPVLRSADSGVTWKKVELPAPYKDHFLGAVAFVDAKRGWLVGNRGVILTTNDGGENWTFEAKVDNGFLSGLVVTRERLFAIGVDGKVFWREI